MANFTQFLAVGPPVGVSSTYFPIAGVFANNSSEAIGEVPIRQAGKLDMLYAYFSTAPTTGPTTVTLRASRANTALAVTCAVSQSGIVENISGSATIVNTDELDYTVGSADPSYKITAMAVRFSTTTNPNTIITPMSAKGNATLAASTTYYNVINGNWVTNTTEANAKFSAGRVCTASNMDTYVSTNSFMGTSTAYFRQNGINGNQTLTYTMGQSGAKEDTTHTDDISIGDDINFLFGLGAGFGSVIIERQTCQIYKTNVTAATLFFPFCAGKATGTAVAFNVTTNCGCSGDLIFTTTEANTQLRPRFTMTIANIGAYVSANTIATSATTVMFRVTSADTNVSLSYAAGVTGLLSDSTLSASVASAVGKMNYQVRTPNTSGSITFTWIGLFSKAEGLSKILLVNQAVNRASNY